MSIRTMCEIEITPIVSTISSGKPQAAALRRHSGAVLLSDAHSEVLIRDTGHQAFLGPRRLVVGIGGEIRMGA